MRSGTDTAFIIGGADGLDADIKNSADEVLALSALTLPHGLARVLLAEQLYRAVMLIKGPSLSSRVTANDLKYNG